MAEEKPDIYCAWFPEVDGRNATSADDPSGRKWTWEEDGMTVYRSTARTAPGCHENCGVLVYVKDGVIDHIEGDSDNPFNQGRLCIRCLSAKEMIYHEDRVLHPMKRARKDRGKDVWEQITWDEAYQIAHDELMKVIETYGPESIWVTQGTGRDIGGYGPMLSQMLGTPNFGMGFLSGQACYCPRLLSTSLKVGDLFVCDYSQFLPDRYDDPRWEAPEYMLVWGNNPVVANSDGMLGHWLVECMKRGSKVICMDPKLTWMAGKAEFWFQVRPGTDAALALAICNVLVEEDLYDHEFVDLWTYGFEALADNVKNYPPEKAAAICGVDAEMIRKAARAIGKARSVCVQWGVALDHTSEGFITGMAVFDILGLTGNFEKPGSMIAARPPFGVASTWLSDPVSIGNMPAPEWAAPGSKRMTGGFNGCKTMSCISQDAMLEALETGEPYPIKAIWFQTNNPIVNMGAEPQRILPAVKNNTDFVTVVDTVMTPTAMALADLFLPAMSFAERPGITGTFPHLAAMVKCIEPLGECKSDMQIIYETGRMFHGEEKVPFKNDEEFFDYCLKFGPYNYQELKERVYAYPEFEYNRHEKGLLRPDGSLGFNTDTGRYNFYSIAMQQLGYTPVPTYEEPVESPVSTPELFEEYPLILTTGARHWSFFHSEHRQSPSMRRLHPEPTILMNPEDAKEFGIKEGDWVLIENKFGSCRQKATLSTRLKKGVVSADHGWWFPERKDKKEDDGTDAGLYGTFESNINQLLPMRPGKTGLGNSYKSQLCKVSKIER